MTKFEDAYSMFQSIKNEIITMNHIERNDEHQENDSYTIELIYDYWFHIHYVTVSIRPIKNTNTTEINSLLNSIRGNTLVDYIQKCNKCGFTVIVDILSKSKLINLFYFGSRYMDDRGSIVYASDTQEGIDPDNAYIRLNHYRLPM